MIFRKAAGAGAGSGSGSTGAGAGTGEKGSTGLRRALKGSKGF